MSVVEQLGADQVLEEAALLAGLLQVLEVGVEVQRIVGVAAVVVRREAGEEELERIREPRIRSFAFLELEPLELKAWQYENRRSHVLSVLERYHLAAQRAIARADRIDAVTYGYTDRKALPAFEEALGLGAL